MSTHVIILHLRFEREGCRGVVFYFIHVDAFIQSNRCIQIQVTKEQVGVMPCDKHRLDYADLESKPRTFQLVVKHTHRDGFINSKHHVFIAGAISTASSVMLVLTNGDTH